MNIRKPSSFVVRGFAVSLVVAGISGCGTLDSLMQGEQIDYKSAGKGRSLEIPPDLTQLQRENRYALPKTGTATASGYTLQQGARPTSAVVAPNVAQNMRIERAGNQRWLVVGQEPEVLWPQLKEFWQDMGFLIHIDSPESGVLETDWAENRAKIPQDIIRNTLGKVLDSLYSTGERDKFRTRLERGPNGVTEIYISHRGMQEVIQNNPQQSTIWTPRPADAELEAEFLGRLMARLGAEDAAAKAAVSGAQSQPARAKLVRNSGGGYVEVDESFERAWRRVGLALDRVGFTVEDRDREAGLYYVRYVDPDADNNTRKQGGFLSRLNPLNWGGGSSAKVADAARYRVSVKGAGNVTQVAVLDSSGRPESSRTGDRILSLLNEQLR